MKKNIKYIPYLIIVCVMFLSVGYASFSSKMTISGLTASVRPEKDIRVTGFYAVSNENSAQSLWEEYSVNRISSDIYMPYEESTISYKIQITNFGGITMAVTDILNVDDNLEIVYTDYELGDTICDETKNEEPCKYGAKQEFTITIKYKEGMYNADVVEYQLRLDLEFDSKYTLNYLLYHSSYTVEVATDYMTENDSYTYEDGIYTISKNSSYFGLFIPAEYFEDGKTYALSYKIKKLSGTLYNVGGHSVNADEKSFLIDGVASGYTYNAPTNNITDDTSEHLIEFVFEYDSTNENPYTPNYNIYIQLNRMGSSVPSIEAQIYDIELYEVVEQQVYSYDEEVTIKSDASLYGYTFLEWNTSSDGGGVSYYAGHTIQILDVENNDEIFLYPQWEKYKNYVGYKLYDMVKDTAVMDNVASKYVTNENGIDFGAAAGETNGKGVYTFSETINDTFPTYYYRGLVENNNVLFGNFCWKIVRTTETGGTKLIYNGVVVDGSCNNSGSSSQLESTKAYNSTGKLEYGGYSYGDLHTLSAVTLTNSTRVPDGVIFGSDVEYADGQYSFVGDVYTKDSNMLSDTANILKTHHYTCFKTVDDVCTSMYYVYMLRGTAIHYVLLNEGEVIEDVIYNSLTNSSNTTSSKIKTYIDSWYSDNMTDFTHYLEDTIWCNDRSIGSLGGWDKTSALTDVQEEKLNFSVNYRLQYNKAPSLQCENLTDRFTVNSENGNGVLTYPTALLTLDEAALAGYVWGVTSDNNYLNNDMIWWTMTPTLNSVSYIYLGVVYSMLDNVHTGYTSNGAGGVRPAISLANEVQIASGYGTTEEPFTITEIN